MAQPAFSLRPSVSGAANGSSQLSYAQRLDLLTKLTQEIARGGEVRPLLERLRQEVAEPLLLETLSYRRDKGQLQARVWNAFLNGLEPASAAECKALLDRS
jgi:hypothetical protein